MKKEHVMTIGSLYLILVIAILGCISLLISSCNILYYRSAHALLLRNKYRACVHLVRAGMTNAFSCTQVSQERAFVVLNRCNNYLRDSMIAYIKAHGHATSFVGATFADADCDTDTLCSQEAPVELVKSISTSTFPDKNKPVFSSPFFFVWPLKRGSFWVSSFFGPRKRRDGSTGFHTGIDLAALKGTPIYAARSGIVIQAYYTRGYGKTIVIQHGKKFRTRYAHLNKICVAPGDFVRKNTIIGEVGDTGFIRKEGKDGSHLHFEVYEYERRVNPMQFLPKLV